jgi:TrmH family RNA methyltransferase
LDNARVTSRRHESVQRLRDVRDGRDKTRLFVEGLRLAEELLQSGGKPEAFYATPGFLARHGALDKRLREAGVTGHVLDDQVMAFVSDVNTPPGLILLAERADSGKVPEAPAPLYVVLDRLQSPNNVGAVVRAAEAAGAQAVFQLAGGADPLGPKALRASAGAAFRVPVRTAPSLDALRAQWPGVACVVADPRGDTEFTAWDWTAGAALVLGAETGPEPHEDLPTVRVPMSGRAESLNVAVAAGIILYEAYRQRQNMSTPTRTLPRQGGGKKAPGKKTVKAKK